MNNSEHPVKSNGDGYSPAVETAREYYNSSDADNFYFHVWGGEDIHIGLYERDDELIAEASQRTVGRMLELLGPVDERHRVLDLGAGYGGSMRYLARHAGCRCVALNLSEVENERNRRMNREQGLANRIEVVDGDFTNLDYDDGCFDIVWSQDAFLHSGDRARVCAEAARVLRDGGRLIFTDPMQADDAPAGQLQPIYDRLHLDSLGSPEFYRATFRDLGLVEQGFEDHSEQLPRHYARVRQELVKHEESLRERGVSDDYIQRMKVGLQHWVDGGRRGDLTWGIFRFLKS
ncbi:methyltransferase domain-containing protein [Wenzhouxiangella sp. AB-CW3]|uniref:methyltransferase domain-containing protein n=1 Tax=Wenzhouxiangella sp. AB-CW3 TaxID=2771012 RepID=UPI00168AF441|nr:methyltransferase domain-containing protein [Wenzhouxiangella sp. AB-CW3]QOC23175.1 methyltransferase domain-containing protein [Wenzhouxiangella sp. AB-CW3]